MGQEKELKEMVKCLIIRSNEAESKVKELEERNKVLEDALKLMLANFKANESFGTLLNKQELISGISIMTEALSNNQK
ncbi:MAG: hypothetical protein KBA90_14350 [Chitinophagaceae bacterium]|nr:hypothetical protein [Chitinophagaceae bacterium]